MSIFPTVIFKSQTGLKDLPHHIGGAATDMFLLEALLIHLTHSGLMPATILQGQNPNMHQIAIGTCIPQDVVMRRTTAIGQRIILMIPHVTLAPHPGAIGTHNILQTATLTIVRLAELLIHLMTGIAMTSPLVEGVLAQATSVSPSRMTRTNRTDARETSIS